MSSDQLTLAICCIGGDYTTQFYGDCNKPLMECQQGFVAVAQVSYGQLVANNNILGKLQS